MNLLADAFAGTKLASQAEKIKEDRKKKEDEKWGVNPLLKNLCKCKKIREFRLCANEYLQTNPTEDGARRILLIFNSVAEDNWGLSDGTIYLEKIVWFVKDTISFVLEDKLSDFINLHFQAEGSRPRDFPLC